MCNWNLEIFASGNYCTTHEQLSGENVNAYHKAVPEHVRLRSGASNN